MSKRKTPVMAMGSAVIALTCSACGGAHKAIIMSSIRMKNQTPRFAGSVITIAVSVVGLSGCGNSPGPAVITGRAFACSGPTLHRLFATVSLYQDHDYSGSLTERLPSGDTFRFDGLLPGHYVLSNTGHPQTDGRPVDVRKGQTVRLDFPSECK